MKEVASDVGSGTLNESDSSKRQGSRTTSNENSLSDRPLTALELAEYFSIHPKSVYKFAAKNGIPCMRIGRLVRSPRDEFARWCAARKWEG